MLEGFAKEEDVNKLMDGAKADMVFTDPPYGILSDYEGYPGEQEYGGCYVFNFNPKTKALKVMTKKLDRPNGIAFSENEKKIYIADTGVNIKHLYSFDLNCLLKMKC